MGGNGGAEQRGAAAAGGRCAVDAGAVRANNTDEHGFGDGHQSVFQARQCRHQADAPAESRSERCRGVCGSEAKQGCSRWRVWVGGDGPVPCGRLLWLCLMLAWGECAHEMPIGAEARSEHEDSCNAQRSIMMCAIVGRCSTVSGAPDCRPWLQPVRARPHDVQKRASGGILLAGAITIDLHFVIDCGAETQLIRVARQALGALPAELLRCRVRGLRGSIASELRLAIVCQCAASRRHSGSRCYCGGRPMALCSSRKLGRVCFFFCMVTSPEPAHTCTCWVFVESRRGHIPMSFGTPAPCENSRAVAARASGASHESSSDRTLMQRFRCERAPSSFDTAWKFL